MLAFYILLSVGSLLVTIGIGIIWYNAVMLSQYRHIGKPYHINTDNN